MRVAPAVALHEGISVYSPAGSGPVSTWIYGPLPLLLLWPAGLASGPIGALGIAGAIHILLRVLTLVLACWFWPVTSAPGSVLLDRQRRFAAALLCVLLVRNDTSGYVVFSADAPGLAFGLVALLALARHQLWFAAAGAVAAAACKQTLLGVALAQVLWLGATVAPRAAVLHAARITLLGAAAGACAVGLVGWAGLWHAMVEVPGALPWAAVPERLEAHFPYLVLHVVLPLAVMAIWRGCFLRRAAPALLPALAFLCTLPMSLAGFLKIGGNVNSLHGFWLWFPPSLIVLATGPAWARLGRWGNLALALVAVALASVWLQTSRLPVLPNVQAYREASYLAARLPGRIWFPLHPLVTLYSDRRLYHDLDGLGERRLAGRSLSERHFFAHVPSRRQASATLLPVGWGLADPREGRLPPDTPVRTFGLWRIDGRLE